MERSGIAISLVERGWRAARECARLLVPRGVMVTHVVRGSVASDVRAVIGLQPGERMIGIPRSLYGAARLGLLAAAVLSGRVRYVIVDHERAMRDVTWWCRRFGWMLVMAQEVDGRCVYQVGGREQPPTALFGLI